MTRDDREDRGASAGGAGADLYTLLAQEVAEDRRRLRGAAAVALLLHLLLLVAPLPDPAAGEEVRLPPSPAVVFRLTDLRFAPPSAAPVPVDPVVSPVVTESETPAEPTPLPAAAPVAGVELLVPVGPAGQLVPPQPLSTPPPPYPPDLARRGVRGEVVLTLVVDAEGRVVEVTVEEGPEPLGQLAAHSVRQWIFLPATVAGSPLATAIRVRATFPAAAAAP